MPVKARAFISHDDFGKRMPQENVHALKVFLELKRSQLQPGSVYYGVKLPAKCWILPERTKEELSKFLASLPKMRFFEPDGKPRAGWHKHSADFLSLARDYASKAAETFKKEARSRAESQTFNNHPGATDFNDIVNPVDMDTGRYSAAISAWNAAIDVLAKMWRELDVEQDVLTRELAGEAGLRTGLIAIRDLDFKNKKRMLAQARSRWEVWQKGYCLACEVRGRLFVYWREPRPTAKSPTQS